MKKLSVFLCSTIIILFVSTIAQASPYTFTPPGDPDLNDLEHSAYYTWGIDWDVPAGEQISGASLVFDNIRNYNNSDNDLWVHLLDSALPSVVKAWDNQDGDVFANQGILLNHWHNISATGQDITYDFEPNEIATLIDYLADGNVGLGFDPDCHFYNDGIELHIQTTSVPIPAAVWLLGTGLIGLVGVRRRHVEG